MSMTETRRKQYNRKLLAEFFIWLSAEYGVCIRATTGEVVDHFMRELDFRAKNVEVKGEPKDWKCDGCGAAYAVLGAEKYENKS